MTEQEFFQQLEKIRQFQINDLRNADSKANANFLVFVGCLNATELLGGIQTGLIGSENRGDASKRFQSGIDLLGGSYPSFREDLWALRNSMVHAYLGSTNKKYDHIAIGTDKDPDAWRYPHGVQEVKDGFGKDCFIVNVTAWIRHLDTVWDKLLADLRKDVGLRNKTIAAFERQPYLR